MSSDETSHWKQLAEQYKASWLEAKTELEEYQASSRELEAELEAQVEQAEARSRQLTAERSRLLTDLETLQEKYDKERVEANTCITRLQEELDELRRYRDTLEHYVRELEQTNDDLERAKRETVASLEDFEYRMNQCIERNAFLESELDEKEMLVELVQRLRDEARDLKQEVDIRSRKSDNNPGGGAQSSACNGSLNGNHVSVNGTAQALTPLEVDPLSLDSVAYPATPCAASPVSPRCSAYTPMSPRARISALSIVGDLLSKVGALENKLSQCRNFVKDHHYLHQEEATAAAVKGTTGAGFSPRSRQSLRKSNDALGNSGNGSSSNLPVPVNNIRQPVAAELVTAAACSADSLHLTDHNQIAMPNGWRAWFTGKSV